MEGETNHDHEHKHKHYYHKESDMGGDMGWAMAAMNNNRCHDGLFGGGGFGAGIFGGLLGSRLFGGCGGWGGGWGGGPGVGVNQVGAGFAGASVGYVEGLNAGQVQAANNYQNATLAQLQNASCQNGKDMAVGFGQVLANGNQNTCAVKDSIQLNSGVINGNITTVARDILASTNALAIQGLQNKYEASLQLQNCCCDLKMGQMITDNLILKGNADLSRQMAEGFCKLELDALKRENCNLRDKLQCANTNIATAKTSLAVLAQTASLNPTAVPGTLGIVCCELKSPCAA